MSETTEAVTNKLTSKQKLTIVVTIVVFWSLSSIVDAYLRWDLETTRIEYSKKANVENMVMLLEYLEKKQLENK